MLWYEFHASCELADKYDEAKRFDGDGTNGLYFDDDDSVESDD